MATNHHWNSDLIATAQPMKQSSSALRASLIQTLAYIGLHWNGQSLTAPNPRWTLFQLAQSHRMLTLAPNDKTDSPLVQPYICPEGNVPHPQLLDPYWCLVERHPAGIALWHYALQQWSVPVGSPRGFNLRLLLLDKSTGYLIGILGLCPAAVQLAQGWKGVGEAATAFVMGAIPPFNRLRAGKLVALLAQSPYIRRYWWETQVGQRPFYRVQLRPLIQMDTYAIFGKSSVLNRLKGWHRQGSTAGHTLVHLVATGWDKRLLEALPEPMRTSARQMGLLPALRLALAYFAIEPAFLQPPLPMAYYRCSLLKPSSNPIKMEYNYSTECDHQLLVAFWKNRWAIALPQ